MRLRLSCHETDQLKQFARKTKDARLLRRAQALLDLDAGDRPGDVARRYQVARSTIYNWIERCHTRGLSDEALCDLPRPGRPPRLRPPARQEGDHNAT